MAADSTELQTVFLRALAAEKKVVWVFLVNGIKLTGQLLSFDRYVLALQSPTGMQTIFKSAVSTVCEAHAVLPSRLSTETRVPHSRGGTKLR